MTTIDVRITIKDGFGIVYGLLNLSEPLQIRYVGQTVGVPEARLFQHLHESRKRRDVHAWIESVQKSGSEVALRVLGIYPVSDLNAAEVKWIQFWGQYCELVNVSHYKFPSRGRYKSGKRNALASG